MSAVFMSIVYYVFGGVLIFILGLLVGLAIKEGIALWNAIEEDRENKRIEEALHGYAEAVRLDYKNSMKIKERKKWLQYHMEF